MPIVEEGIYKNTLIKEVFDFYFSDIWQVDVIVLGCTHFPLLADFLQDYFQGAKLVHSGDAIVDMIKNKYKLKQKQNSSIKFLASENPEHLKKVAKQWF